MTGAELDAEARERDRAQEELARALDWRRRSQGR